MEFGFSVSGSRYLPDNEILKDRVLKKTFPQSGLFHPFVPFRVQGTRGQSPPPKGQFVQEAVLGSAFLLVPVSKIPHLLRPSLLTRGRGIAISPFGRYLLLFRFN